MPINLFPIDDTVLTLFSKAGKKVKITILTKTISQQLVLDVKKYNEQYPEITLKEFHNSHDRFIIIDGKTVYHFGASLKDLGKKWFAFSKFDKEALTWRNWQRLSSRARSPNAPLIADCSVNNPYSVR